MELTWEKFPGKKWDWTAFIPGHSAVYARKNGDIWDRKCG